MFSEDKQIPSVQRVQKWQWQSESESASFVICVIYLEKY